MLHVVEAIEAGNAIALVRCGLQDYRHLCLSGGICTKEKWTDMTLKGLLESNLALKTFVPFRLKTEIWCLKGQRNSKWGNFYILSRFPINGNKLIYVC